MIDDPAGDLLGDYLRATAESDAELHLTRILTEIATPLIARVVASACRNGTLAVDAEDIVSDTVVDLLRRLRDLRDGTERNRIQDLRGYVVACAYNRCHERLRARFPARNRLRNHLQYLFGHHAELALWRAKEEVTICGFRVWTGRAPIGHELASRLTLAARRDAFAEDRSQINALVFAALRQLGAPLVLDDLLDVIARLICLEHQRVELPLSESQAASAPGADFRLHLKTSLRQLWADIHELTPRQRTALLLNLHDAHGREVISLLPHTNTASVEEIAQAIQIPTAVFRELWNQLPLTDAAIGDLLGATSRQVIKLRRLARERLRRMAKRREKPAPATLVRTIRTIRTLQ